MKIKACLLPITVLFITLSSLAQTASINLSTSFEMNTNNSILKNTETSENHKMLLAAMKAAGLEDILSYAGPFTVFAPSDVAFEKLPQHTLKALLDPNNKEEVQALIRYHIVAGNFSASRILKAMCSGQGQASFTTIQGDKLIATMDGVDIILTDSLGNTAKITVADSNQCNGVIHEIDSVILPSKFSSLP